MRILVTGGAGFVGSHLVDRLLKDGHEVVCVDSLYSGRKENIAHHFKNPHFRFLRHDIRKPLPPAFTRRNYDRIYNLACPASPVQYQFDPVLTLETSVLGVHHSLKLARHTGARMLQASTSEVYGDPLEHPQKESYFGNVDPVGPRSCYDEGKRAAETLCKDYHAEYGVDVRVIRIFNTYGPRMMFHDGRVLSNFILQALLGEPITVHGSGEQTRSFMYVDDLVEGMIRTMETDLPDWGPINLGNPDERTIGDLAALVQKAADSKSEIVKIAEKDMPGRAGDPKQRCPDIARAKKVLGWTPKVPFAEGLNKTIADFKKRLEHKPRIVVFLSAKDAAGEAATVLRETAKRLPGWECQLVTTNSQLAKGTTIVPRLLSFAGSVLYPLRAAWFARRLENTVGFEAAWAFNVRRDLIAAALFSLFTRGRVPLLLSVVENTVSEQMLSRGRRRSIWYRIFLRYAHRWQVIGAMTDQQREWLETERQVQAVPDHDYELIAKRTNELFQELQIEASRRGA